MTPPAYLELSAKNEVAMRIAGCVSGAISLVALCCVIMHNLWEFGSAARRRAWMQRPGGFNRRIVFVLMWIELVILIARMMGRSVFSAPTLCQIQGAVLQGFGIASSLWIACVSYNLYRWIIFGETEKKQSSRYLRFMLISFVLPGALVGFQFAAEGYDKSVAACGIVNFTHMMLHYFLPTFVGGVANIVLLLRIRCKLGKRSEWNHPMAGNRVSKAIGRKTLLYAFVYLLHRLPPYFARFFPEKYDVCVSIVTLVIINLEGCSYAVVYGGLFKFLTLDDYNSDEDPNAASLRCSEMSVASDEMLGKRGRLALLEDIDDEAPDSLGTAETNMTAGSTLISVTAAPNPTRIVRRGNSSDVSEKKVETFFQLHAMEGTRDKARPRSMGIFVSTFNMGECDIAESELVEWVPIGYDVYVIGVQECMNLVDLQTKVRRHLVNNTGQNYVYFSHDIGKRATALGYHGYIALTVFVLDEAIQLGRFEMPQQEAASKHAQEVYRGKSLLMFGRASNKGAVGIRFRYGNASFAFVNCHFASDSSVIPNIKKRSFAVKKIDTPPEAGSAAEALKDLSGSGTVPPSKIERRNQDVSEVLQHLCLDEDGGEFGFALLHHHSFVLGDMNYRMSRQNASATDMLDLLHHICKVKQGSSDDGKGTYQEVATPSMLRLVPGIPDALAALIHGHDELTSLREGRQLFFGFEEPAITFMPTFRRIRGQILESYDMESLLRNYSVVASGGGMRVPSYTDRILHTSLPGRTHELQCLYYDSCESVTTSDHKPVCAVYRIQLNYEDEMPSQSVPMPIPLHPFAAAAALRRKDDGTGDVRIKIEFRSIQWLDAIEKGNASWFGQLQNVEFGFLFPLPCEDVFARQRKLQEVAEHLTWGETMKTKDGGSANASKQSSSGPGIPPQTGSNLHVVPWNRFVEHGVRCATRISKQSKKHAAVLIRTRSRPGRTSRTGRQPGKEVSPRSRMRAKSTQGSSARPLSPRSAAFTSSGTYGMSLGYGAFSIEEIGKGQETHIPLTLGGNLVGRLHVRVSMRDLHDQLASL